MRHGEPDISGFPDKVSANEWPTLLARYSECGIVDTEKPEHISNAMLKGCHTIVTSDLRRSIESASLLSSHHSFITDSLFREIEDAFIPIPFLTLAPKTWGNIFILLWLVGAFALKRAFREGKVRARHCAKKLADLASEHGKVLFVGHGFINAYIATELRSLGWDGPRIPSKKYWEYGVYQKNTT